MDLGLQGKRVVVTGGSKGIGRSICETYLREGASVEFCARNPESVAATEKEFSALGSIKGTSVDVADGEALAAWINAAAQRMGGIDYAISNASALANGASAENWQKEFNVDIMGTQVLFDATLPYLTEAAKASGDAGIVVISSVSAAETSAPNAYGAAKAALIHIVKGLARQQAPMKIRCNAVSPGTVYLKGGVWNMIEENMPDAFKQAMERNPMGRMGTPQELADATVFLGCPRSTFTTGANLVVDGGITSRVNF